MTTKDLLRQVEEDMKKAIESCRREFQEVRTGRASPSLVEGLRVDCYGSLMIVKQIASISVPDPRLIVIQPWDPSIIGEVEKAILKSNLGITPSNDGKAIRLAVPQLSEERRQELAKVVSSMAEEGRISLRTIRREANEKAKKMEQDKAISEDERFKAQDEIQKLTDRYMEKIQEVLKEKEKELTEF